MAWLWSSWEEYVDAVHPVELDRPVKLRLALRDSTFETECALWNAAKKLTEATESLRELGFKGEPRSRPPNDASAISQAHRAVQELVLAGEELLLYHKRLAKSDASYGFLHQHDILEHWGRYAQTGRIVMEIQQLTTDVGELLQGYEKFVQTDHRFIVDELDLPDSLESDFRLARNLFSVGFDEVALLIAGRGLEGVLRKIADVRKIVLESRGKKSPACEVDVCFYDLIETMFQVRWKTRDTRLITPETKALLHYLRTLRNSGAHPTRSRGLRHSARATPPLSWPRLPINCGMR